MTLFVQSAIPFEPSLADGLQAGGRTRTGHGAVAREFGPHDPARSGDFLAIAGDVITHHAEHCAGGTGARVAGWLVARAAKLTRIAAPRALAPRSGRPCVRGEPAARAIPPTSAPD